MTREEFGKKMKELLEKDYNHETPDVPRSKEVNALVTEYLVELAEREGLRVSKAMEGYCETSMFVCKNFREEKTGHIHTFFAYIHTPDFRYDNYYEVGGKEVLVRGAKDENDYTGETNEWADIANACKKANSIIERNARRFEPKLIAWSDEEANGNLRDQEIKGAMIKEMFKSL